MISGDYLEALIIGAVLLIQIIAQFLWVKWEVKTLRRESEAMDKAIEVKREANVEKLREIYDLKISDNRAYAKGLFEQQSSEYRALGSRLGGVEAQLTKILDLLMKTK